MGDTRSDQKVPGLFKLPVIVASSGWQHCFKLNLTSTSCLFAVTPTHRADSSKIVCDFVMSSIEV